MWLRPKQKAPALFTVTGHFAWWRCLPSNHPGTVCGTVNTDLLRLSTQIFRDVALLLETGEPHS